MNILYAYICTYIKYLYKYAVCKRNGRAMVFGGQNSWSTLTAWFALICIPARNEFACCFKGGETIPLMTPFFCLTCQQSAAGAYENVLDAVHCMFQVFPVVSIGHKHLLDLGQWHPHCHWIRHDIQRLDGYAGLISTRATTDYIPTSSCRLWCRSIYFALRMFLIHLGPSYSFNVIRCNPHRDMY